MACVIVGAGTQYNYSVTQWNCRRKILSLVAVEPAAAMVFRAE